MSFICRNRENRHRYLISDQGRFRTVLTHEKDFLAGTSGLTEGTLEGRCANWIYGGTVALGLALPALALSSFCTPEAYALPEGWQVSHGDVVFHQNGDTLIIQSGSEQNIVNFLKFNIAQHETVNIQLPNSSSSILNRVTGGYKSYIDGTLTSNGNVFLVNPAGISISPTANITVGSLTASTLNISDQNYLNNNFVFDRDDTQDPAAIDNDGTILAMAGSVNLIGGAVSNTGAITAPEGTINMVVGEQVTLDMTDHTRVSVTVDEGLQKDVEGVQTAIANAGNISAEQVHLQAQNLKHNVYTKAVNNTGIIQATSVEMGEDGLIRIVASSDEQSATVENSGDLIATSDTGDGGAIEVLGDKIGLTGEATLDVSGATGGGTIHVGGDYQGQGDSYKSQLTFVDHDVTLKANATDTGNGGEVVLWSDGLIHFRGSIESKGGLNGGDGGLVEVSGKEHLQFLGEVDTTASQGHHGSLLLDPTDLYIVANTDPNLETSALSDFDEFTDLDWEDGGADTETYVNVDAINNATSDVILRATDDIFFNAVINMINDSVGITAEAGGDITVNQAITTRGGTITFVADDNSSPVQQGDGSIYINAAVATNGGNLPAHMYLTSEANGGSIVTGAAGTLTVRNQAPYHHHIYFTADNIDIGAQVNCNTPVFSNYTAGRDIEIGGADIEPAGAVRLSEFEYLNYFGSPFTTNRRFQANNSDVYVISTFNLGNAASFDGDSVYINSDINQINSLSIYARNAGNIVLNANVSPSTGGYGGRFWVYGTGTIIQNAGTISPAGTNNRAIQIRVDNNGVGTSGNPLDINLTDGQIELDVNGDVFINHVGNNLDIIDSTLDSDLTLTSSGDITLRGNIDVTGDVDLTAGGANIIRQTTGDGFTLTGNQISLAGAGLGLDGNFLLTDTQTLNLVTAGSAYINNTNAGVLTLAASGVTGDDLKLTQTGNLQLSDDLDVDRNLYLTSTAGDIDLDSLGARGLDANHIRLDASAGNVFITDGGTALYASNLGGAGANLSYTTAAAVEGQTLIAGGDPGKIEVFASNNFSNTGMLTAEGGQGGTIDINIAGSDLNLDNTTLLAGVGGDGVIEWNSVTLANGAHVDKQVGTTNPGDGALTINVTGGHSIAGSTNVDLLGTTITLHGDHTLLVTGNFNGRTIDSATTNTGNLSLEDDFGNSLNLTSVNSAGTLDLTSLDAIMFHDLTSAGNMTLTAGSTINDDGLAGSLVTTPGTLRLITDSGVGTTNALDTAVGTIRFDILTQGTVDVSQTGHLNLGSTDIFGSLNLLLDSNSDLSLTGHVYFSDEVEIQTQGTGAIINSGSYLIYDNNAPADSQTLITLTSGAGGIGTIGNRIRTRSYELQVDSTSGDIFLESSHGNATRDLHLLASNLGTSNLDLDFNSGLEIDGALTANTVTLNSIATIDDRDITLNDNILATGMVTLNTVQGGQIVQNAGTIQGTALTLDTDARDIGSSGDTLDAHVASIDLTTSGSAYLSNTNGGMVTLAASGVTGERLTVTTVGGLQLTDDLTTTETLTLVAQGGDLDLDTLGARALESKVITLTASAGDVLLGNAGTTLLANADPAAGGDYSFDDLNPLENALVGNQLIAGGNAGAIYVTANNAFTNTGMLTAEGGSGGKIEVNYTNRSLDLENVYLQTGIGGDGIIEWNSVSLANGANVDKQAGTTLPGGGDGTLTINIANGHTLTGAAGVELRSTSIILDVDGNIDLTGDFNASEWTDVVSQSGSINIVDDATDNILIEDMAAATTMNIQGNDAITYHTLQAGGNIDLTAGSLVNDTGVADDLITTAGRLTVDGNAGVGTTSALETQVGELVYQSATGDVNIDQTGALTLRASSAAGDVTLVTDNSVVQNGTISGGNISLTTGTTFSQTSGVLDADGGLLALTLGSGDLGTSGNAVDIDADVLTLNFDGNVYVSDSDEVTLNGVTLTGANELSVTAAGDLDTAGAITTDSGDITLVGATIDINQALSSTSGDMTFNSDARIDLDNDVTTGGNVTLNVLTGGNIDQTDGFTLTADNLVIDSVSGNIGTVGNDFDVAINTLDVDTIGNLFLHDTGDLSVVGGSYGTTDTIDILADNNLSVVASITTGNGTDITYRANNNVTITGAVVAATNGNLIISADDDGSGVGTLDVSNTLTSNTGSIDLDGASIDINNTVSSTSGNIIMDTTAGSNGTIQLDGDVTTGGNIDLTADGSGEIAQTNGNTLTGNVISLASGTGDIGPAGNALDIDATTLNANTGGTIRISEANAVTVNNVSIGAAELLQIQGGDLTTAQNIDSSGNRSVTLLATNNLTVGSNITGSGGNITLTADMDNSGAGSLDVSGTVSATTGQVTLNGAVIDVNQAVSTTTGDVAIETSANSNGNVTLTADVTTNGTAGADLTLGVHGSGTLTQVNGNTIVADVLTLYGSTGQLGSVANPIDLDVNHINLSTAQSAYIHDTDTLRLSTINLTGSADAYMTATNIDVNNAITLGTGNTLDLRATHSFDLNANITGADATLVLHGDSSMNGSGAFVGNNSINLTDGTISIQGNTVNLLAPVSTGMNPGNSITITSTAAAGNITLQDNVVSQQVTMTASGSGNITNTAGVVRGNTISLSSTTGDIGTSANPLDVDGGTINANTGGNIYVTELDSGTLNTVSVGAGNDLVVLSGGDLITAQAIDGSAGRTIDLRSDANLTIGGDITGSNTDLILVADRDVSGSGTLTLNNTVSTTTGNVLLQGAAIHSNNTVTSTSGNLTARTHNAANGNVSLSANMSTGGNVTLQAFGTGQISHTAAPVVSGNTVNLISDAGDIGSSGNSFDVDTNTLNITTNADAVVLDTNSVTLGAITAGAGASVEVRAGASLNTSQNLNMGDADLTLQANNGVTISNQIQSTGGDITLEGDMDASGVGDLTIGASIQTTDGVVSFQGDVITVNADITSTGGGGGITLNTQGGVNGNIDILGGDITSTNSAVTLQTAVVGAITVANNHTVDTNGGTLTVRTNTLDLTNGFLDADTGRLRVVPHSGDVGIGDASGVLNLTQALVDRMSMGILEVGSGSVSSNFTVGTLDLTAHNADLTLNTTGTITDVSLTDVVANIRLANNQDFTITGGGGPGSGQVGAPGEDDDLDVHMGGTGVLNVTTNNGGIYINTRGGDLILGLLNAGTGAVELTNTSGHIFDGNGGGMNLIAGADSRFAAVGSIGATNALEITVNGKMRVTPGAALNGVAARMNGTVTPYDTLFHQAAPPGDIIFNGLIVGSAPPEPPRMTAPPSTPEPTVPLSSQQLLNNALNSALNDSGDNGAASNLALQEIRLPSLNTGDVGQNTNQPVIQGMSVVNQSKQEMYQSSPDLNIIAVTNLETGTVTHIMAPGNGPHILSLNNAGTRAFIGNVSDRTISVMDLNNQFQEIATIPLSYTPGNISVSQDGQLITVTSQTGIVTTVIDAETFTVLNQDVNPTAGAGLNQDFAPERGETEDHFNFGNVSYSL